MRSCYRVIILIIAALSGFSAVDCVESQDFPYLAPVAPEFDGSGVVQTRGPSKAPSSFGTGPKLSPITPEAMKNFGFAPPSNNAEEQVVSNQPSSNYPPPSTNGSAPSQTPPRSTVRRDPSPTAGPRQQNGPTQQPARVDCSQYPAIIANAKSEAEMQVTARYYLTCLMQDGWPMENARAQVIQTIEAAFRANR